VILLAFVVGYLVGAVPTAIWIARMWGLDLRDGGTGNPGANNARRLGGYRLAILVLAVEMAKGAAAVSAGLALNDDGGAVAAALGAVTGNVYNVWLRFRGGKGLGITAGVLLGLWPLMLPIALLSLILFSALTRSTGKGTLAALALLVSGAVVWDRLGLDPVWGVSDRDLLLITAVGISVVVARKHWIDARHPFKTPVRP
jgi:glycerol-3-phosphate acyltransferase PlsY